MKPRMRRSKQGGYYFCYTPGSVEHFDDINPGKTYEEAYNKWWAKNKPVEPVEPYGMFVMKHAPDSLLDPAVHEDQTPTIVERFRKLWS